MFLNPGSILTKALFAAALFLQVANGEDRRWSFQDPRDGHKYRVTNFGKQDWFVDNLAFLPVVNSEYSVYGYEGASVKEAKNSAEYKKYGVLYSWQAAMTACPNGWHLPSEQDWIELENFLDVPSPKEGETWYGTNQGAEMREGGRVPFEIRFAGWRSEKGFVFKGKHANFWTSTEIGGRARERLFSATRTQIGRSEGNKTAGFSVRCLSGKAR